MEDKPTLHIDIHEPDSAIAHCRLVLNQDFNIKVERYECGDYFIGNVLGIERKSPSDFRASVFDRRIFQQAHELQSQFTHPMVIVTGTMDEVLYARNGGFNPAAMWGACASLLVSHRVPVWFVGEKGLPYAIQSLAKRAINGKSVEYTPVRRDATTKELGVAVLSDFPGVGTLKAKEILKVFGTLGDALANVDRWAEVDGIGPKIRDRVKGILNEKVE